MNQLNPLSGLIKEIRETYDMEEVAKLLTTNNWVAFLAAPSNDGYLFCLGRIK